MIDKDTPIDQQMEAAIRRLAHNSAFRDFLVVIASAREVKRDLLEEADNERARGYIDLCRDITESHQAALHDLATTQGNGPSGPPER